MNITWEKKIGPATVASLGGAVAMLVSIGVAWGALNAKIDAATVKADQAKTASEDVVKTTTWRDKKVGEQSERLSKIETAVQFIVPAIQRIERKLDAQ